MKVTEEEKILMIQLWGDAQKHKEDKYIQRHNLYMRIIAEKYGYDWQTHSINPETGEIVEMKK